MKRRLLAQIGITNLSVLVVVFYFGITCARVIAVISALCTVVFLISRRTRRTVYLPVMSAVAMLACVVSIMYTTFVYNDIVQKYDQKTCSVTATLTQEPYIDYDTNHYYFNATEVDGVRCDFDFILYSDNQLNIDVYDTADMTLTLYAAENDYNKSKGYFITANVNKNTFSYSVNTAVEKPFLYKIITLKRYTRAVFDNTMSDRASNLSKALLLGDKHALSYDIRKSFIKTGASHLIVVSGMHFSILFSLILMIVIKISNRFQKHIWYKYILYILLILMVITYMLITGMTPSVVRSGIMFIVLIVGHMIRRTPYLPNSLGLASLVIVILYGPYVAGDTGLILSFSSTLSLFYIAPFIQSSLRLTVPANSSVVLHMNQKESFLQRCIFLIKKYTIKMINIVISLFSVNLSVLGVSVCLSILLFGSFSTMSLISGLLLYFLILVILYCSLFISILYYIPILHYVTIPLGRLSDILSGFIYDTVSFLSELPFSYIKVTGTYVYVWIAVTAILALVLVIHKQRKKLVKLTAAISVLTLILGFLLNTALTYNKRTLNVYSVSNGEAVIFSTFSSTYVLNLDCNKNICNKVIRDLSSSTSYIEYCSSVSHTDRSLDCLNALCKEFAIDTVLLYNTDSDADLSDTVKTTITPADSTVITADEGSVISYTRVSDQYVIMLTGNKRTVMILPDKTDAADIPSDLRSADIIVVGSCPYNSDLLSCDTLIVSADKNVADSVKEKCCKIYNTILSTSDGDISIDLEV